MVIVKRARSLIMAEIAKTTQQKRNATMKTIVTAPLRITVESHEAIKKKSLIEMITQEAVIRKILHDWALKQNQKQAKKGN